MSRHWRIIPVSWGLAPALGVVENGDLDDPTVFEVIISGSKKNSRAVMQDLAESPLNSELRMSFKFNTLLRGRRQEEELDYSGVTKPAIFFAFMFSSAVAACARVA